MYLGKHHVRKIAKYVDVLMALSIPWKEVLLQSVLGKHCGESPSSLSAELQKLM